MILRTIQHGHIIIDGRKYHLCSPFYDGRQVIAIESEGKHAPLGSIRVWTFETTANDIVSLHLVYVGQFQPEEV